METSASRRIEVLVAHPMGRAEDLVRIAAVDPRLEVGYAPYIDESTRTYLDSFAGEPLVGGPAPAAGDFAGLIGSAEVLFALALPPDLAANAARLEWVQLFGAGVDARAQELGARGVRVTTSSGINAAPIAEFCLLSMLMHVKQMTRRLAAQRAQRWERFRNSELRGKTLGIVGPGRIGQAVAQRARCFEMSVLATRRRYAPGVGLPHIDQLYPPDGLREMLARCDFAVVSTSLGADTRGLIGEAELAVMKPGAFLINVSRGAVVDEAALVRALEGGRLGGAALDVFEREPLPPGSPLWGLPNVIVTPHNAGGIREHAERATLLFCENLARWLAGQPLENEVDPQSGT